MTTLTQIDEIQQMLNQMSGDAHALGGLPNAPEWFVLAIQVQGKQIRQDCEKINLMLGGGEILLGTERRSQCDSIDPKIAAIIRSELQVLAGWAHEMESVPSFPDSTAKRNALLKCRQIPSRCDYIRKLLRPMP